MNFDDALRLIHDHNPRTREEAARALGLFYNEEAVALLLQVLQSETDERVKISILRALGNVYALEAVSAIEALLSQSDLSPALTSEAQNALDKINAHDADQQPEVPPTEFLDPHVPDTEELDRKLPITERPTEPLSRYVVELDDPDIVGEDTDPLGWLRDIEGDYLIDENRITVTGNAEETYDWMTDIQPEDLQEHPPDETPEIIQQVQHNPFDAYLESLDENTIHHEHDAESDWLEDYVAEIDEEQLFYPHLSDDPLSLAPEDAETVEELDDIWLEAINQAIENYTLLPEEPDIVNMEDDAGWLNTFGEDELFLVASREYKRGDVVFLPGAELEFKFDGRYFLLKTEDDAPEATFPELYVQLTEIPEPFTLEEAPLPEARPAWERMRERLLTIGLVSIVLAGASFIIGVSVFGVILLGVGAASLLPALIFIRRDWVGANALEDRLERIAQTETLESMQAKTATIASKVRAEAFNLEDLDSADRALANRWFARHWKRQLKLAGMELRLTQFAALHLLSGIALYAFALVLSGGQQVTALLLGVVGVSLPQLYTSFAISQRVTRFKNQLPDALGLWVNALRSGYSLLQALESISRDAPEPTATEFKRTVQEMQVGVDLEDAFDHLLERVSDEDLDFVLTAVNIQREVGGNLAEILDIIGYTIRERIKLAGETATQVKARYRTFFAIAVLLPLLQTVIFTPYFEQALTTITGQVALFMGYTLIAITLAFSANMNHVLRRESVSTDNFWPVRRDTLFDLGVGMALIGLIFALGTAPLLVFWLGLMLFVIVSDHAVLGLVLSVPIVATAVFTDGDLSGAPAQLANAISGEMVFGVGALGLIVIGAVWYRRRTQSPIEFRLGAMTLKPALRSVYRVAPAKGVIQSIIGKVSTDGAETDDATAWFYVRCFLWALVLGGLGVLIGILADAAPFTIGAYGLTGATGGYFIPTVRRYNQIRRQQEQIRMALPDALDLLVICMEAGLGFDSAMGKVYEKWDNELALAFGRVLREIQLGKLRRVAMRDMATRLNVPEVDSFVAAIIQSDQLGVSLARTMRIQSDQIRVAWKRRFENKVSTNNQIMDQLSLFLFVPGINLWLIAPIIARMFTG